jgi:hypothetical protein
MYPEKYSLKIAAKQSAYSLFKILLFAMTVGFFGLLLSHYNDLRDKQDQFTGEYFFVSAISIATMAYITTSIANIKIFSNHASEKASKNIHGLFNAANSKNELALLGEIKPIHRRHNTGNTVKSNINANALLSKEREIISENGHSLFSLRKSCISKKSVALSEINHIHRQRSYSL